MRSKRSTTDGLSRIREALELLAPVMHRPDAFELHDRAVRILTGEPPRAARPRSKSTTRRSTKRPAA
jgi:hypothetical protein